MTALLTPGLEGDLFGVDMPSQFDNFADNDLFDFKATFPDAVLPSVEIREDLPCSSSQGVCLADIEQPGGMHDVQWSSDIAPEYASDLRGGYFDAFADEMEAGEGLHDDMSTWPSDLTEYHGGDWAPSPTPQASEQFQATPVDTASPFAQGTEELQGTPSVENLLAENARLKALMETMTASPTSAKTPSPPKTPPKKRSLLTTPQKTPQNHVAKNSPLKKTKLSPASVAISKQKGLIESMFCPTTVPQKRHEYQQHMFGPPLQSSPRHQNSSTTLIQPAVAATDDGYQAGLREFMGQSNQLESSSVNFYFVNNIDQTPQASQAPAERSPESENINPNASFNSAFENNDASQDGQRLSLQDSLYLQQQVNGEPQVPNDLAAQNVDFSAQSDDFTAQKGDFFVQGNELTAQNDDLAAQDNDFTTQNGDVTNTSDDDFHLRQMLMGSNASATDPFPVYPTPQSVCHETFAQTHEYDQSNGGKSSYDPATAQDLINNTMAVKQCPSYPTSSPAAMTISSQIQPQHPAGDKMHNGSMYGPAADSSSDNSFSGIPTNFLPFKPDYQVSQAAAPTPSRRKQAAKTTRSPPKPKAPKTRKAPKTAATNSKVSKKAPHKRTTSTPKDPAHSEQPPPYHTVAELYAAPFLTLTKEEKARLLLPLLQGFDPKTGLKLAPPGTLAAGIEPDFEAMGADHFPEMMGQTSNQTQAPVMNCGNIIGQDQTQVPAVDNGNGMNMSTGMNAGMNMDFGNDKNKGAIGGDMQMDIGIQMQVQMQPEEMGRSRQQEALGRNARLQTACRRR
ncbi:hypothetical protein EJ02DRAFT_461948 [Clathrospora elynae]|uniref:Uncharacterized protein n=1 Tax=Clathrospora elynae TaxID=706981 RepID=A0A6A5T2Y7_9PLEO|nr:hypothetical protein EJ02DRAFT_461948 [Clathrospora elynae]